MLSYLNADSNKRPQSSKSRANITSSWKRAKAPSPKKDVAASVASTTTTTTAATTTTCNKAEAVSSSSKNMGNSTFEAALGVVVKTTSSTKKNKIKRLKNEKVEKRKKVIIRKPIEAEAPKRKKPKKSVSVIGGCEEEMSSASTESQLRAESEGQLTSTSTTVALTKEKVDSRSEKTTESASKGKQKVKRDEGKSLDVTPFESDFNEISMTPKGKKPKKSISVIGGGEEEKSLAITESQLHDECEEQLISTSTTAALTKEKVDSRSEKTTESAPKGKKKVKKDDCKSNDMTAFKSDFNKMAPKGNKSTENSLSSMSYSQTTSIQPQPESEREEQLNSTSTTNTLTKQKVDASDETEELALEGKKKIKTEGKINAVTSSKCDNDEILMTKKVKKLKKSLSVKGGDDEKMSVPTMMSSQTPSIQIQPESEREDQLNSTPTSSAVTERKIDVCEKPMESATKGKKKIQREGKIDATASAKSDNDGVSMAPKGKKPKKSLSVKGGEGEKNTLPAATSSQTTSIQPQRQSEREEQSASTSTNPALTERNITESSSKIIKGVKSDVMTSSASDEDEVLTVSKKRKIKRMLESDPEDEVTAKAASDRQQPRSGFDEGITSNSMTDPLEELIEKSRQKMRLASKRSGFGNKQKKKKKKKKKMKKSEIRDVDENFFPSSSSESEPETETEMTRARLEKLKRKMRKRFLEAETDVEEAETSKAASTTTQPQFEEEIGSSTSSLEQQIRKKMQSSSSKKSSCKEKMKKKAKREVWLEPPPQQQAYTPSVVVVDEEQQQQTYPPSDVVVDEEQQQQTYPSSDVVVDEEQQQQTYPRSDVVEEQQPYPLSDVVVEEQQQQNAPPSNVVAELQQQHYVTHPSYTDHHQATRDTIEDMLARLENGERVQVLEEDMQQLEVVQEEVIIANDNSQVGEDAFVGSLNDDNEYAEAVEIMDEERVIKEPSENEDESLHPLQIEYVLDMRCTKDIDYCPGCRSLLDPVNGNYTANTKTCELHVNCEVCFATVRFKDAFLPNQIN